MRPRPQTSRWRRSAITFGPVGRVLATILALLPVWWTIGVNIRQLALEYMIGFFFAGVAYSALVVPLILRDVWRRVPDRDKPMILDLPAEPPAEGESIMGRKIPSRW